MPAHTHPLELSVEDASQLLEQQAGQTLLLDVREPFELEFCRIAGATHVPMRQIPERIEELPRDRHILVLCHHGHRSLRVTEFLRARGLPAVSNVAGGIEAWAERVDPALARY